MTKKPSPKYFTWGLTWTFALTFALSCAPHPPVAMTPTIPDARSTLLCTYRTRKTAHEVESAGAGAKRYPVWQSLEPGDIVEIVAPASRTPDPQSVERAAAFIRSLGLVPRVVDDLFGDAVFTSNTIAYRSTHLARALTSPDSKAVWAIRGGYGSSHLMPELLKLPVPTKAKLVIGFSDITALHIFLQKQWGWATLHARVLYQFGTGAEHPTYVDEIKPLLFGEHNEVTLSGLVPLNKAARDTKPITGSITGGNLSIVQTSIGTAWQIDTKGKILFLEDVDERGYRLDRIFTHLEQAGVFENVQAILLGNFVGGDEPDGKSLVPLALAQFAESMAMPVFSCPGIGHGQANYPLPLGPRADLIPGDTAQLIIHL